MRDAPILQRLAQMALGILILQLFLSGIFYLERVSVLDAAFVLLKIINEGEPTIMVGRYGSILTQSWPWLGVKLGLPLNQLMFLYSISFTFLNLLVGSILYRKGEYHWFLALASYFMFWYSDGFFWTNNEIHQAVALFCLGAGFLHSRRRNQGSTNWGVWIFGAAILSLSIFTHPLMIVITSFYVVLFLVEQEWNLRRADHWGWVSVLLVVTLVKYNLSSGNWYDGAKFKMLSSFSLDELGSVFQKPLFSTFFSELPTHYLSAALLALFCWIAGLYHKRYLGVILSLVACLAHVILVSIVVSDFLRFYTESQWMLISFFLILPLMCWWPQLGQNWRKVFFWLFVFSMVWWLYQFSGSASHYTERRAWHEDMIEQMSERGEQKWVLPQLTAEEQHLLQMDWGLPAESLLLSSRSGRSRSYIAQNRLTKSMETVHFHNCFDTLDREELHSGYFQWDADTRYRLAPSGRVRNGGLGTE